MTAQVVAQLPLHRLLEELEAWRADPNAANVASLRDALSRLLEAYAVHGCYIVVNAPPLAKLNIGAGSLSDDASDAGAPETVRYLESWRASRSRRHAAHRRPRIGSANDG